MAPPIKASWPASRQERSERSWLRGFFFVLIGVAIVSTAVIYAYTRTQRAPVREDSYVALQVQTLVGTEKMVVCKLSLQLDSGQERALRERQKQLDSVVSEFLAEAYRLPQRPELGEVRQGLLTAINQQLPAKLQVRDVLIQDLTVGFR